MADNHIIIGLGGTGGKIIKEYRKLYVEKNKNLDNLKNVKFLWFDTSDDDLDNDTKWVLNGYNLALKKNIERFNFKEEGQDVYSVLSNKGSYNSVASWIGSAEDEWDENIVAPDVVKTASGQIRKLGRLNFAFYLNKSNSFIEKVRNIVAELTLDNPGSKIDIHLIAGLAGGTGNGSFIDAIAQILKSIDIDQVFPYVLTPNQLTGGNHSGQFLNQSFYFSNGYAALKDLNAFSIESGLDKDEEEIDELGKLNLFDLKSKSYGKRLNDKKKHPVNYIFTDEASNGESFTTLSDDERHKRTASWLYLRTIIKDKEFQSQTARAQNQENKSATPASLWGQTPKNIGIGSARLVIPKQEMRDYFKYYFLINSLNKIQYDNFKEKEGFVKEDKPIDRDKRIEAHKKLKLQWGLKLDQLRHFTLDINSPTLPEHEKYSPKHYNFSVEIQTDFERLIEPIESFGVNDVMVDPIDLLTAYNRVGLNYMRDQFRSVGIARYYNDWSKTDNVLKNTEFIKEKVLKHIFGCNSVGETNWRPMSGYLTLIKETKENYFNDLISELNEKIDAVNQKRETIMSQFNAVESAYKKEFGGWFGVDKSDVSDLKTKGINKLIELYECMADESSFNFALKVITELQKNTFEDIYKIVEKSVNGIDELIDTYFKKLAEQDPRKKRNNDQIKAYSPDKIINEFEKFLSSNESEMTNLTEEINKEVYKQIQLFSNGQTDYNSIEEVLQKIGANQSDIGIKQSKNLLGASLNKYDIYNDNLIKILCEDFAGNASNEKLVELLQNLYIQSTPCIELKEDGCFIRATPNTIVILPKLLTTDGKESQKQIDFKKNLEDVVRNICGQKVMIINKSEDDKNDTLNTDDQEYKSTFDEIIFVRTKSYFPLSSLSCVQEKLFPEYNDVIKSLKTNGIDGKFFMHLQEYEHLPEIIPISNKTRVEKYIPLVILLHAMNLFDDNSSILQIEKMKDDNLRVDDEKTFYFDETLNKTLKGNVFIDPEFKPGKWKTNFYVNQENGSFKYYQLKELVNNNIVENIEDGTDTLIEKITSTYKGIKASDEKLYEKIKDSYDVTVSMVEFVENWNK